MFIASIPVLLLYVFTNAKVLMLLDISRSQPNATIAMAWALDKYATADAEVDL